MSQCQCQCELSVVRAAGRTARFRRVEPPLGNPTLSSLFPLQPSVQMVSMFLPVVFVLVARHEGNENRPMNKALVAGALGVTGRSLVNHLVSSVVGR